MVGKIFFTHVMKTGGTSVGRVLRESFAEREIYPATLEGVPPVMAKTFPHLLLGLDEARRSALRFFYVHQPAWVAEAVAPEALRITVIREPVSRTISHLRQLARSDAAPDDVTEIYDDETWRSRLVDHQCQLFAASAGEAADTTALDGAELDEADQEQLRRAMRQFWETSIARPIEVDRSRCDTALDRLTAYDVVGITDDIPGFTRAVAHRTGLTLPPVERFNATPTIDPVPPELIARIEADTRYDRELYERARELAGRAG